MNSLYNTNVIDLTTIPSSPGVYIYQNQQKEIIYVGKAVNLKKRVLQYFQNRDALGYKTRQLVSQIASAKFITVDSEIEALVLESGLIKQYRPKYNSQLKDDKSYIYITISRDKFPLVRPAFKSSLNDNDIIYGPFPDSRSVKSLLKTIRQYFLTIPPNMVSSPVSFVIWGFVLDPPPTPKNTKPTSAKSKKFLPVISTNLSTN